MTIQCIQLAAFKYELKLLLEKYDASISATVGSGSDTHGIYDESMEICIRDSARKFRYHYETVGDGWEINSKHLTHAV